MFFAAVVLYLSMSAIIFVSFDCMAPWMIIMMEDIFLINDSSNYDRKLLIFMMQIASEGILLLHTQNEQVQKKLFYIFTLFNKCMLFQINFW